MNYRVGIVTLKGRIESKDFLTREEVDEYILTMGEAEKVSRYRIMDLKTNTVIETEQGQR
jgi:hypothetical protein